MNRFNTIRYKLFFSYSVLLITVSLVFSYAFHYYTSNLLKQRALDSIQQVSNSISTQVDDEIKKMNLISINLIFAGSVINPFFNTEPGLQGDIETLYKKRNIIRGLSSVMGPMQTVFQINLYDTSGNIYGVGNTEFTTDATDLSKLSWFSPAVSYKGNRYITASYKNTEVNPQTNVISLVRSFTSENGEDFGVIEVQEKEEAFTSIVENTIAASNVLSSKRKVYIINNRNETIYPAEQDKRTELIFSFISKQNKPVEDRNSYVADDLFEGEGKQIISYHFSKEANWRIVAVESEDDMLASINAFTRNMIIGSGLFLLVILQFSYLLSRKLTLPIHNVHRMIRNMQFQTDPRSKRTLNSGFNELEELNMAFHDMCERLSQSMKDALASKEHEMQSKMLALQAQMNPHFLYNTIATLDIMIEEGHTAAANEMCKDMCSMLRYISSSNSLEVKVETELSYVESYLHLMRSRYQSSLKCILNVDEKLMLAKIPKLIVQPLIENCIKYGREVDPPWTIEVVGNCTDALWEIEIRDNGKGFNPDMLAKLQAQIRQIDQESNLPALSISGMGLLNLYARLKLTNGDKTVFLMENRPDGGAMVKIGGILKF
ncbi:MAG: histidine kinase [Gorillibacterium sp.]|nr:histidine kinase [Gorillibacterium sp.]